MKSAAGYSSDMWRPESLTPEPRPAWIYLDHNATTPVADEVLAAMLPWFQERFGNPTSSHAAGRLAADAAECAREQVAALLTWPPEQIVFTSGATEANNLAIKGVWSVLSPARNRVLVTTAEHGSVLGAALALPRPASVDLVPVDATGMVDVRALDRMMDHDVALVSVMAANNELGTLNPIPAVAELVHRAGAVLHTDATQWVGKLPVEGGWGADLISFCGHKFYGPKGVGGLCVRRGIRLAPLLDGGGQEQGVRGGTLNVAAIVGLGAACALAADRLRQDVPATRHLRDLLSEGLAASLPGVSLNGHPVERLPNTVNVRFAGAPADAVLRAVPTLAASSRSSSTTAGSLPSHVLCAIGLDPTSAGECIRFSVGRSTTTEHVEQGVALLTDAVALVRRQTRLQGTG